MHKYAGRRKSAKSFKSMNTKSVYVDGLTVAIYSNLSGDSVKDYPRSSLPLLDLEDQSLDLDYSFPHACLEQQGRVQPRIARVAIQL
jgi:hypothetical protein